MSIALRIRLAWLNCLVVAIGAVALCTIHAFSILEARDQAAVVAAGPDVISGASAVVLSALAPLIIVRRPENVLGPSLSVLALLLVATGISEAYAYYGLKTASSSVPGAVTAAWLAEWLWIPAYAPLITLLFLLFPDGRLPSRRWRPVALLMGAHLMLMIVLWPLDAGVLPSYPEARNPYALAEMGPVIDALGGLFFVSMGLCVAAMVVRFRGSTGAQRLQLKWFAWAAVAAMLVFAPSLPIAAATGSDAAFNYGGVLALVLVLAATVIAILRYRLYDIDRIVSRTLTYGLLTAALAATYLALVVGLEELLRPLSGGSDLAIVVTTLLVAALFLPARRRVQRLVDRRFNRHSYDASRTIEAFSTRLRDQIDLDTLRGELLAVVEETMQPSTAGLWLRRARRTER
jgi:hypothetical protein